MCPWTGRDDGPDFRSARWHNTVVPWRSGGEAGTALLGFASDEGVRRNRGRVGARFGPEMLRSMLGSLAVHGSGQLYDAGDVHVDRELLEDGQTEFADALAELLADGHFTIGLGGGHEIAYASYRGVAQALGVRSDWKLGVLNIDAHLDLRREVRATSGTVFSQMADAERAAGRTFNYAAIGISEFSNTRLLFDRARDLGARVLRDVDCHLGNLRLAESFVTKFADSVDDLYLTIDLDVLPAATAPGVSAPAGFGVSTEMVRHIVSTAARTGKLVHADIAELNPKFDIDNRTARTGAALISDLISNRG